MQFLLCLVFDYTFNFFFCKRTNKTTTHKRSKIVQSPSLALVDHRQDRNMTHRTMHWSGSALIQNAGHRKLTPEVIRVIVSQELSEMRQELCSV